MIQNRHVVIASCPLMVFRCDVIGKIYLYITVSPNIKIAGTLSWIHVKSQRIFSIISTVIC